MFLFADVNLVNKIEITQYNLIAQFSLIQM